MLRVRNLTQGAIGGGGNPKLIDAITSLSLTTSLRLCWDFGDSDCYPGSGQTVTDLSAQGSDGWLGIGTSSEAEDPSFNGVAGGLSANEYMLFGGDDILTLKSKPTWVDSWHKTNGVWTLLAAVYSPNFTTDNGLFGNNDGGYNRIGTCFRLKSAETIQLVVTDGGGTPPALDVVSTSAMTASAWNIVGAKVDEAAGAGNSFYYVNGAEETFNGSYTSPSASAASWTPEIGGSGGEGSQPNEPLQNGARIAWISLWETGLSVANVDALYALMKGRHSLA